MGLEHAIATSSKVERENPLQSIGVIQSMLIAALACICFWCSLFSVLYLLGKHEPGSSERTLALFALALASPALILLVLINDKLRKIVESR